MKTHYTRTVSLNVDDVLAEAIRREFGKLTPERPVHISFIPQTNQVQIEVLTEAALNDIKQIVPGNSLDVPLRADVNAIFFRGLVRRGNVLLTGVDHNAFVKYGDKIETIVAAIDSLMADVMGGNYHMTLNRPLRQAEFLVQYQLGALRPFMADTVEIDFANELILAVINGEIKALPFIGIEPFVKTGMAKWLPIDGQANFESSIVHLEFSTVTGGYVATLENGQIFGFSIIVDNEQIKLDNIGNITPAFSAAVLRYLGNLNGQPNRELVITEHTDTTALLRIQAIAS